MDTAKILENAKAFARAQSEKMMQNLAKAADQEQPQSQVTPISLASYSTSLQFPPSFSQQVISAIYASCKIYVGSLHADIQEPHLRQIFSTYGSIRSLSMSFDAVTGLGAAKHKGYAFMEFDFPEAGILAIESLNGVEFGGKPIKVCRPKDFNAMNFELIPKAPVERVFVSNINEIVNEDMLQGIFEAFGPVQKVSLLPDAISRTHRGCGYVQFKSSSSATTAIASIKAQGGLELAGSRLNVSKAVVGGDMMHGMEALKDIPVIPDALKEVIRKMKAGKGLPVTNPMAIGAGSFGALPVESATSIALKAAVAAAKAKIAKEHLTNNTLDALKSGNNGTTLDDETNLSIGASKRFDIMQKLMRKEDREEESPYNNKRMKLTGKEVQEKSAILLLRNMVTVEDTADEELEGEIQEECSKYGKVKKVVIGSPPEGRNGETVDVVVEFATMEDADQTRVALDGRYFAGRRISATFRV
ncbi:UNVERIFIED_CONTAM: Poly(U)-binding-splicing factor puf60 [Siphonaria sp. JEL0065]|nr:Poly(U)-binding-splicing factor puf60 [Siphonaria sp. JEL0065]